MEEVLKKNKQKKNEVKQSLAMLTNWAVLPVHVTHSRNACLSKIWAVSSKTLQCSDHLNRQLPPVVFRTSEPLEQAWSLIYDLILVPVHTWVRPCLKRKVFYISIALTRIKKGYIWIKYILMQWCFCVSALTAAMEKLQCPPELLAQTLKKICKNDCRKKKKKRKKINNLIRPPLLNNSLKNLHAKSHDTVGAMFWFPACINMRLPWLYTLPWGKTKELSAQETWLATCSAL